MNKQDFKNESIRLPRKEFSRDFLPLMLGQFEQDHVLEMMEEFYPKRVNQYTVDRVNTVMQRHTTRSKFMTASATCYGWALHYGILDAHFPPITRRKLTPEFAESELGKYKNRSDVQRLDQSLYAYANKNGILDKIMPSLRQPISTNDIRDKAMDCSSEQQFRIKYRSHYNKAVRMHIIDSLSFNDMRNAIKTIKANHQYMSVMEAMAEVEKFL